MSQKGKYPQYFTDVDGSNKVRTKNKVYDAVTYAKMQAQGRRLQGLHGGGDAGHRLGTALSQADRLALLQELDKRQSQKQEEVKENEMESLRKQLAAQSKQQKELLLQLKKQTKEGVKHRAKMEQADGQAVKETAQGDLDEWMWEQDGKMYFDLSAAPEWAVEQFHAQTDALSGAEMLASSEHEELDPHYQALEELIDEDDVETKTNFSPELVSEYSVLQNRYALQTIVHIDDSAMVQGLPEIGADMEYCPEQLHLGKLKFP